MSGTSPTPLDSGPLLKLLGELEHLWAEYTGGHLGGSEFNEMVCAFVAEKVVPLGYVQSETGSSDAENAERYRWFREQGWARRNDIVEAAGEEGHMLDHFIDKGRCGL